MQRAKGNATAIDLASRVLLPFLGLAMLVLLTATLARAEGTTISHGYSYFGSLKYPADFPHLDYVNPDAPKGGEIAISNERGTFDSFNPYARKGVPGALASIGTERLMTSTADEIGTSYGLIAESLEYPEDQSWVIFTLRPNVRFQDGTPTTAHDVAFTHNLFMEQGLISFREGVSRIIASVEALDDLRVKFTFQPDAPVRERISQAGATPVFSQAWFEKTGARLDESRLETNMGTGPYVLDSFDINERITYRRNPDYWGAELPINIGRNNFDAIRIEYFADGNAAFEGFKAGAYTYRIENSSKQWATQYDFPALTEGHAVKAELPDGAQASGQGFVFNLRREKFQDIRVREALGLMFNFEWSNETLFYDLYARIHSFAENSYLEAKGLPTPEELAILEPLADLLPDGVLDSEPFSYPASGARQLDRKNLRRASALLDEAGWAVGDDGMRRKNGQLLKVEFLERSPAFDRVINPYVENLRRLGVDAVLNRVDNAQFVDRRYAFDYDIITDHLATGYEPGSNLEQSLGSKEAAVSVFNSPGVADPAVDAIIDVIRNAATKDDLIIGVKTLDRVMRAMKFWVPQWYKDVYTVAYFDMFEYPDPLPPYDLGYLDFWWYNADKHEALKAAGALR
ncbi:extracellular solute-binding protein [Aliiroseovarius subalbicans]|uniref:extracellular solute-binding protein n=1 Tax=Aliiroseovarius subalbicans TaxID=2925840 RepID=UPI001F565C67|nr:extracellular solute-binding protein [Aliiroseovarius subalbicans]MCI2399421.1 extracellular solute-binding protein [Aliiroseovarius subalbicans]